MTSQEARDDEREAAWLSYKERMLALDGQNNLAGRGLVPSWRDWHAGWDAVRSKHPEPEVTMSASQRVTEVLGTDDWVIVHSGNGLVTDVELDGMEAQR